MVTITLYVRQKERHRCIEEKSLKSTQRRNSDASRVA